MKSINKQAKSQKGQAILNLNEEQAREHIEKLLWPDGKPTCPHCGSVNAYRMQGNSCRPGLCRCRDCKKQFTVTVGTIFEDSHIPLATWVKAIHLMSSSKKGISALQLMRNLGLGSYKTAWFMAHRIRYAMQCQPMPNLLTGQIQADETWIGGKYRVGSGENRKSQFENKTPVLALVETDGSVKSRPLTKVDASTLREAMKESCDMSSQLVTDELTAYGAIGGMFDGGHKTVNHSHDEYSRKSVDAGGNVFTITTNTAESYFALLKRGIHGTFHHVSKKHMHRYCDEFDFRWNGRKLEDTDRRNATISGSAGKRLMYKMPTSLPKHS